MIKWPDNIKKIKINHMLGKLKLSFGKKKTSSDDGANQDGVEFNKVKTGGSIVSDNVLNSGNVANLALSKEEQKKLLENRKKTPTYIVALKYSSLATFVVVLVGFLFLKADLDKSNGYFGILGLEDNTGSKYFKVERFNQELTSKISIQQKKLAELKRKIAEEDFGNYTDLITGIQEGKKNWYKNVKTVVNEETDEEESIFVYGLIDSFSDIETYFEDARYKTNYFIDQEKSYLSCSDTDRQKNDNQTCFRPTEFGLENEIEIKNFSINDQGVNLNLEAVEFDGRVFILASEFVDMINSFNFYQNGVIRSFNRKKLKDGDQSIAINLRFGLQDSLNGEIDSDDKWLENYENWLISKKKRLIRNDS